MKNDEPVEDNGYFTGVVLNVCILGLVFFIVFTVRGFQFDLHWAAVFFFFLAGLFSSGIGRLLAYAGIRRIGPTRVSALKNGAPFVAVITAFFVLGETITLLSAIGMLLIMGGILYQGGLLYKNKKSGGGSPKIKADSLELWWGYMITVLSAISLGFGQVMGKKGLEIWDDAFFAAWVGALTSLLFIHLYEGIKKNLKSVLQKSLRIFNPYFIIAGIVTSFGPLFFLIASMYMKVGYVSIMAASEPILTVLLSILFLKTESVRSVSMWITILSIFAGVLLIALA